MVREGKTVKFVLKQYVKMGVQNLFLPMVYRLCKRRTVNKKRVIFADAHHRDTPFSMRALLAELEKTDLEVITLFSDYGRESLLRSVSHMIRFMKLYANAGYVVICDNFLPAASCRKRPETKVIQLWHACGALKKFGCDAADDIPPYYRGNVQKNCDYVTVSAKWCVPHFASAMDLPQERFLPVGISRTDLYYREEFLESVRGRFASAYPQARGKKVILWAPTFRGNAGRPVLEGGEAIDALAEKLGGGFLVLKALHPHMRGRGTAEGAAGPDMQGGTERENVPETVSELTTEELLAVTDLLITDYSSVMFDYMIFGRPIVRFAPDLAQYEARRGFYMDYRSLPGALVTDEKDLYAAVCRELETFDAQAIRQTFRKYMGACDGGATARIRSVIEGKTEGL